MSESEINNEPQRFGMLRTLASVYQIAGAVLLVAFVLGMGAVCYFGSLLPNTTNMPLGAATIVAYMSVGISVFISAITLFAVSDGIRLALAIEDHNRQTAEQLQTIALILNRMALDKGGDKQLNDKLTQMAFHIQRTATATELMAWAVKGNK